MLAYSLGVRKFRRFKKKVAHLALVCILLLTAVLPVVSNHAEAAEADAQIRYSQKWAVIPEISEEVRMDGNLDESIWQEAASLTDFVTAYHYYPAPEYQTYHVAYDTENLYIGGVFSNEEIEALAYVEVIISPYTSGGIHYTASIPVYPPNRTMLTEWNDNRLREELYVPSKIELTDITYRTFDDAAAGKFYVEMAIPLSSITSAEISPGDEWRMNVVHLYNINTKPMNSWLPIKNSFYMDRDGTVIRYMSNLVDHNRLGSVFFKQTPSGAPRMLDDGKLTYIDFTTKQFSFPQMISPQTEIKLEWKEPAGDWEVLSEVEKTTEGSSTTLTFHHRKPLQDGFYQLRLSSPGSNSEEGLYAILGFDREDLIEAGIAASGYVPSPPVNVKNVMLEPASPQVQAIMEIIPNQNGFRFVGLPEMPELAPDGLYKLSDDGKSLISLKTDTVYPNDEYPETKKATVTGRKGQTITYPYYEDEEGKKYFISAHLWHLQKARAITETENIAKSDPLGAARLLYRFVQASENYVPTTDDRWYNIPMNYSSGPPFNYWGGKWDRYYLYELHIMTPLLRTYVEVKKTNALQLLSEEVGEDIDKMIKEEMIVPAMDYMLSFPIHLINLDYTAWMGLTNVARALDDPEYIHKAVEWMDQFVTRRFMSDGSWYEVTTSYHNLSTNTLIDAANLLKGWTDPPEYISPRTGKRFDNLDLYKEYAILDKARKIPRLLAYPNKQTLPIQDTWPYQKVSSPLPGPLLLPAAGIGRLAIGEDTDQSQLYLQFIPKYGGHVHSELLNINLFAEGQELLPDLGYTYSFHRYFTTSTIGHNTVVVDSKDMIINDVSLHGGNIEQFAQVDDLFQVVRASQSEAYDVTEEYSREPWFISFPDDPNKGYVLDLFRVRGGERHEYTLHGDANHDAYFQTDLALSDYGPYLLPLGTKVKEAEGFSDKGSAEGHYEGYIYVKEVKKAELEGKDQYRLTLETFDDDGLEKAKLNITGLLEAGNDELYLGRSPSIRPARLYGTSMDTNDEVIKYDMPKMVLRREGNDLTSTFATVLEPYSGTSGSRIDAMERLKPDQAPEGASAVKISYGDTTDIILSSPHYKEQPLVMDDIVMDGEIGFIRLVNGDVQKMVLIGGTLLKKGNYEVTDKGTIEGRITNVMRTAEGDTHDALLTDSHISPDVVGQNVIVAHPDGSTHGYKIKEIDTEYRRSMIILDDMDPGFRIAEDDASHMTSFPLKKWTGEHRFRISNISSDIGAGKLLIVPESTLIAVGESTPLSITVRQGDGTEVDLDKMESVTVESSDSSIATIEADSNGTFQVEAASPGKAVFTVSVNWQGMVMKGTATVYVTADSLPIRTWTPLFTDLNDQVISDMEGVSHIRVHVKAENTSADEQSVVLIVALCDANENVLRIAESSQLMRPGEITKLDTDLDLTNKTAGSFIKVMIWDSKSGMRPYSAEARFPNGEGR
ncbi:heparinase II/III family protein [Paenibacillus sp. J2TS4]|uniref:heparinase II/III domain-containing protein n=1 Tax=Paenibacillus sp. J2TS4 TaxID=2807194 RepID=UPI001B29DCF7|nr:heparinase II/III family protein [Paenibacillus sp. J2TS4]GIP33357.1 hypothetical protein J2TS4_25670 [Paenibacillus sp. J2TS4]